MVFRAIFDKIKKGRPQLRGVFCIASLFRLRGKVEKTLQSLEKPSLADVASATAEIVDHVPSGVSTRKSPAMWKNLRQTAIEEC